VNKGLALFQWKQDVGAAEAACRAALAVDSECEAAVATLAQLALQQGHVAEAVDLFARQAELARSEPELVNALTYQFVRRPVLCGEEEGMLMACRRRARSSSSRRSTPRRRAR
jgi:lipopolysaccharide biosynthesis regulator YciM